jgi:capsular polysaccharide export protein
LGGKAFPSCTADFESVSGDPASLVRLSSDAAAGLLGPIDVVDGGPAQVKARNALQSAHRAAQALLRTTLGKLAPQPSSAPGENTTSVLSSLPAGRQCFLFLQGPISPFFSDLAEALQSQGHRTLRVNLNFGDRLFWRGPAIDYRGSLRRWPSVVAKILETEKVTDLLLLGEQRPHHRAAIAAADRLGIRVTVFDYGYLRPDWITCEPDGMSALSRFPREMEAVRALAKATSPHETGALYADAFGRQARAHLTYDFLSSAMGWLYPGYRSHQIYPPAVNYAGTGLRLLMRKRRNRAAGQAIEALARSGRPVFLFAMQMEVDYSIRAYSRFDGMDEPLKLALDSFLAHAPKDAVLVVKLHPLDPGIRLWKSWLRRETARRDPSACDRVVFIDGGSLDRLLTVARGAVMVNSTVGLAALQAGVPVVALGAAIYDIPGLSWQDGLDEFWANAAPPDPQNVADFIRALAGTVQLRGVFYTEPGLSAAVKATAARLSNPEQTRILAALGPSRLACRDSKAPRAAIVDAI